MSPPHPDDVHLVQLYVYDISRGMARTLSRALIGRQLDGIWHTGVVVYGREYFFGNFGISNCCPGGTILGEPDHVEILGETQIPYDVFLEFLGELEKERFSGAAYHLLNHNCNTFSNELAEFLVGSGIPAHILDLPREVMNTPIGAVLANFLDRLGPVPADLHPNCAIGTTVAPASNPCTAATPRAELLAENSRGTVGGASPAREISGENRAEVVSETESAEGSGELRPSSSVDEAVVKDVREAGGEK